MADSSPLNPSLMSKHQLYEIMSQMKTLIEQNKQQARTILVDNPSLTKSLFQAQIMLGMVRPPQAMPNIQAGITKQPQQSLQGASITNTQTSQLPAEPVLQGQPTSQLQLPARQQFQPQPPAPVPSTSLPQMNYHSQAVAPHTIQPMQQPRGPTNAQAVSISFPQTAQLHNLPPPPPTMQHPLLQSRMTAVSNQTQHPIPSSGVLNQHQQPPLPPQPRPPSMQPFQHQLHSQIPHNMGFQPSVPPTQHITQPMFFPGGVPTSVQQGQPPLPDQPPPQHLYMGGSRLGSDFGSQGSTLMQVDRVPRIPGLPDNLSNRAQSSGPPPPMPGQMGTGPNAQPPRPPLLTSEMEQALLQQVMSLTPEQINLLPPEQRQQVLQLQQILR